MAQATFTGAGLILEFPFIPLLPGHVLFPKAEWTQTAEKCRAVCMHVKAGMFTFQVIQMHERINMHFLSI